jgi:hypothetical protein
VNAQPRKILLGILLKRETMKHPGPKSSSLQKITDQKNVLAIVRIKPKGRNIRLQPGPGKPGLVT